MGTGQPSAETLVDNLLAKDPELAQSLLRLEIWPPELVQLAVDHSDEIARSATPEAEQLSIAEIQLDDATRQLAEKPATRLPFGRFSNRVVVSVGLILGFTVISVSAQSFSANYPVLGVALTLLGLAIMLVGALYPAVRSVAHRRAAVRHNAGINVDALNSGVRAAADALLNAMVDRGLRPLVLQVRAQRDNPDFTTGFRYASARGLSAIYNPSTFEVETPGVRHIRNFLDRTPGGSVGLAGPRGTGKSTIIASFVEGRSRRSDDARGRAIQVSAPVEYEPRDFILHVFAELCQAVIVPVPPWEQPEYSPDDRNAASFPNGRWVDTGFAIAVILGCAGLFIVATHSGWITNDELWYGGFLLIACAIFITLETALAVKRSVDRRRHESERVHGASPTPRPGASDHTAALAHRYLTLIRFQQSFTSGWSGSLTATVGPAAATAAITSSASNVRNTLSLPDIVAMFRQFIGVVAEEGPVIIGIDELDKIETPERARAFLNDIKSVFGVNHCYFLISISEDALAGFERRGLPLRDEFDSALDDVVSVDPLDYRTALRLIRGRVVGLPGPYGALIYCLGGGLPRDLIRWARALVQAADPGTQSLGALCGVVVAQDLRRKVSASMLALAHRQSPAAESALQLLGNLEPIADPEWLLDHFDRYRSALTKRAQQPLSNTLYDDADETSATEETQVAETVQGLLAYFYFCATVLQVFTDSLTEGGYLELTSTHTEEGGLHQLALARQSFSCSPGIAINQITKFRIRQGLPTQHGRTQRLADRPDGGAGKVPASKALERGSAAVEQAAASR